MKTLSRCLENVQGLINHKITPLFISIECNVLIAIFSLVIVVITVV